jgi:hypothetical protein
MEWNIQFNEKDAYGLVVTRGEADRDGTIKMARAIAEALPEKKIKKVLIDHTNISAVSGEILDVYNRPKQFNEITKSQGIKVALIIKPEHRDFFNFLETVFINRGFMFMIFTNKETALEWLLKKHYS